jgi:hypothetical protein
VLPEEETQPLDNSKRIIIDAFGDPVEVKDSNQNDNNINVKVIIIWKSFQ